MCYNMVIILIFSTINFEVQENNIFELYYVYSIYMHLKTLEIF